LLFALENSLAKAFSQNGETEKAKEFKRKAEKRRAAITDIAGLQNMAGILIIMSARKSILQKSLWLVLCRSSLCSPQKYPSQHGSKSENEVFTTRRCNHHVEEFRSAVGCT
jgi:hypothetical protein